MSSNVVDPAAPGGSGASSQSSDSGEISTWRGIRVRIIALFLAFGLIPAGVLIAIFMGNQHIYREAQIRPVKDAAAGLLDAVDRNLFERYGDVQAFSLNPEAMNASNWGAGHFGDSNPLVQAMNSYMEKYGLYKLMMLVDKNGKVLAANSRDAAGKPLDTKSLFAKTYADAPWFRKLVAEDYLKGEGGLTGTVVLQPARNEDVARLYNEDGFVIAFAAPAPVAKGASPVYWVNFADFGLVQDIVRDFAKPFAEGAVNHTIITLVGPAGKVLLDWQMSKEKNGVFVRDFSVIETRDLKLEKNPLITDILAGKSGTAVTTSLYGDDTRATGYALSKGALGYPGLHWSAIVQVPEGDIFAALDTVVTTMLMAFAVAGALITVGGAVIGGWFASPIKSLTATMARLVGGDKTVTIPSQDRGDEIGAMARMVGAFRENAIQLDRMAEQERIAAAEKADQDRRAVEEKAAMDARLAEEREAQARERREALLALADTFETNVKSLVDSVASSAQGLQRTAGTVSASAESACTQSVTVAAASEQATANVQTVASAAEELSASINEITARVDSSTRIAGDAVAEARATDAEIKELAAAASKIDEVVRLISDIAEQTNLLALNATIEAARAGEAGRGFAVVAHEVKSLANQTASATGEITTQIQALQGATVNAVAAIDRITKVIEQISTNTTSVAAAVEEQGAATQEIARNVNEAAQGTKQVNATIAGIGAASRTSGEAAAELLTASERLSREAETMVTQVDDFLQRVRAG